MIDADAPSEARAQGCSTSIVTAGSPLRRVSANLSEVRAGGGLPPLFCIFGVWRDVAPWIEPARPVYVFHPPGLDGAPTPERIEDVATIYLEELLAVWDREPVLLAAYSGSGLHAMEMARLLERRGRPLPPILMIDPMHVTLRRIYRRPAPVPRPARNLADRVRWAIRRREWLARTVAAAYVRLGRQVPAYLRIPYFDGRFWKTIARYRPTLYDGPVTVCHTNEHPDPLRGWGPLLPGLDEVHAIPGGHYDLLQMPHAPAVAKVISQWLRKVAGPVEARC